MEFIERRADLNKQKHTYINLIRYLNLNIWGLLFLRLASDGINMVYYIEIPSLSEEEFPLFWEQSVNYQPAVEYEYWT